jgi:hypothetical protein
LQQLIPSSLSNSSSLSLSSPPPPPPSSYLLHSSYSPSSSVEDDGDSDHGCVLLICLSISLFIWVYGLSISFIIINYIIEMKRGKKMSQTEFCCLINVEKLLSKMKKEKDKRKWKLI